MKLYNTKSHTIEEFTPLHAGLVTFYSCGFTAYDYPHIGHSRKYITDDLLKRSLTYVGYNVKHVMNITDVGHLVSDDDEGEDKLEKGARKFGKTPEEIAAFFTDLFLKSNDAVNIIRPDPIVKATDHIPDMITLIQSLQKKGFIYETDEALYFDTQRDPDYGVLSGKNLSANNARSREGVYTDPHKKHPADFVLWFKRVGHHAQHVMHWDSPWGDGFPGWHIECSAMSMKYLGATIDIHSGGVDLIPVHHENEIAQSECATGEEFVRFWVHTEFLRVDGVKMSKSLGNFYTVDDIIQKGFDPLAIRYLVLQTHYRQELNFTLDSLQAAQNALGKLRDITVQLRAQTQRQQLSEEKMSRTQEFSQTFTQTISEDLQIPQALATLWEALKSNIPSLDKLDFLYECDRVFGLKLAEWEISIAEIPADIVELTKKRQQLRQKKDFQTADTLRKEIEKRGYVLEDRGEEYQILKK